MTQIMHKRIGAQTIFNIQRSIGPNYQTNIFKNPIIRKIIKVKGNHATYFSQEIFKCLHLPELIRD